MSTLRRRLVAVGATAIASTLVIAGCAATEEETTSGSTGGDSGSTEETMEGCDFYADYMGNEGTEVEIYTTIIDPEASLFIDSFGEFEECTGITINWNGSQDFETQIAGSCRGWHRS